MASINLGWYSPVSFRPVVEDGRIVALSGRVFLCDECAEELGCNKADEGQVSNVRWHSKGYDECGSRECLCGKQIKGGEEVWLTVDAA